MGERFRYNFEDNVTIDFKHAGWDVVEEIHLAHDGNQNPDSAVCIMTGLLDLRPKNRGSIHDRRGFSPV